MSVKRASQDGILVACAERPRPIALRKAVWSGMNGIGFGTGRIGIECWRFRTHVLDADTAEVALRRGRLRIMMAAAATCSASIHTSRTGIQHTVCGIACRAAKTPNSR